MGREKDMLAKEAGNEQSHVAPKPKPADDDRVRRQAEALRANLKRRKTQQRDRSDGGKVASEGE